MFMYSYCYVCPVLYILFSLCRLAFSDYRDFFLSCNANSRVYLAKMGHGPHSSELVNCVVLLFYVLFVSVVLFCVLFVCKCVLYYCHQVATQLQLNILYHISYITYISYIYHIILLWMPLPFAAGIFNCRTVKR